MLDQTFGERINFHPPLHFLVTEGGVDEAGLFHKIPRIDDSRLASLFGRKVLAVLDIFLRLGLSFDLMIEGKIEPKIPTRPARPKTKF